MELFKKNERGLFKPLPREEADRRGYKGVGLTDYAIINGAVRAWFLDNDGITDNNKFLIVDKYYNHRSENEFCIDHTFLSILSKNNKISIRPIKYEEKKEETIIYGEYPQELVDNSLKEELDEAHSKGTLQETGKIYSSGEIEYIYKGQKYINVVLDSRKDYSISFLNTDDPFAFINRLFNLYPNLDKKINTGAAIVKYGTIFHSWIKVQPIVWIHHPEDDYAITKKILFGARPYEEMLKFLRDDLPKDIQPSDISNIFGVLSPEEQIEKLKEMKEKLLEQAAKLDRILAQTEKGKINKNLPGTSGIALMENSIEQISEQINNALQKRK